MRKFQILARRDGSKKFKLMATISAENAHGALRQYGCNVPKGKRTHTTRRGTFIKAKAV
jgi:hypothetical protein